MGRNNQQRRADKKRRSGRRQHKRSQTNLGGVGDAVAAYASEMIAIEGGEAAAHQDSGHLEEAVGLLMRLAGSAGLETVTATLGRLVDSLLAAVFEGGWQATEVARQLRRCQRDAHVGVVVAAMGSAGCWAEASGAAMPTTWSAQLDGLGVASERDSCGNWLARFWAADQTPLPDGLRTVMEVMGELMHLPEIEVLQPRPSQWHDAVRLGIWADADDPVLAKVRALLAKAESTTFAAEAEALTAKAQELMARHSIDDALARAAGSVRDAPATRRLAVDNPYAEAKSLLLHAVVAANGARSVWYQGFAMMAVIGFRSDLDAIELLFTSLLIQADKAMLEKGSVIDHRGRSRTRSFRQSFLVAYASRIGERLEMAALDARRHAESDLHRSLVPVLAARDSEIDDAVAAAFPHLRRIHGPSVTNEDGWRAGRVAAELATLGPRQAMLDGMMAVG